MIDTADDPRRMARLSLPRAIETPARHPFPVLACLAPVVGSLVIWAITSSPFALVFAFLGPVIAVASMADARIQTRKSARRESARFAGDIRRLGASIERAHDVERGRLRSASPGSLAVLGGPVTDPERWRGTLAGELPITLGTGRIRSALKLDGSSEHEALETVVTAAASLDDAPVMVDARLGIGICGPELLAIAMARGIVLQLAAVLAPESATFSAATLSNAAATAPGTALRALLEALPHEFSESASAGADAITITEGGATTVVAIAAVEAALPANCRVVVSIGFGRSARVVRHPGSELIADLAPEFLSHEQAVAIAALLASAATGRRGSVTAFPRSLSLAELPQTAGGATLPAAFLADAAGPVMVDLVASGPHAVIGGMTGSGKSELLVSWLLAIATRNSPSDVCFLLVDFKGGASFAPVVGLPHVVGLVTDLDERSAHRALQSLTAEIRFRERAIADAGVRSVDDPGVTLPRLVIVVDEFAALVAGFHELHELFADVAARGRSLGVHLILCTQRPAGVVRDSVLANVPLRLSLRVNNRADSTAVVGTDAASALPASPPGRAVLALDGEEPRTVQVALASALDAERVVDRWRGVPAPRRPWRDDLPAELTLAGLAAFDEGEESDTALRVAGDYPFALLDLPEQQRQARAIWQPSTQGNLFVIGAGGSGKSVALATLAAAARAEESTAVVVVPTGIETAWDLVAAAVDGLRRATTRDLLLIVDDVDALLASFGDEHQQAFTDLLLELLRSGGAAGIHVVLSARRASGGTQSLSTACDSRIILRLQNRQDHLLAGGSSALFSADAVPGRGEWRGAAIQIASTGVTALVSAPPRERVIFSVERWPTVVAISTRPDELTRMLGVMAVRLDHPGGAQPPLQQGAIVGDVERWNSQWQRLATLRQSGPLLFDRCSVAEFRTISGQRRLPPPIEQHSGSAWLLEPGGALSRVRIAAAEPHRVTPAQPREG